MPNLNSICVFCGSSTGNDHSILQEAETLGLQLAQSGKTLVYGGSKLGIMGVVANATLKYQGDVIGVIPQFLKKKEVVHDHLTHLYTVQSMHERKLKLQELSDGFIAMPGGFGTLEELFEILTWSQLGLHNKPIGILNINGFYDQLIHLLLHMVDQGFLKKDNFELLLVDDNTQRLLNRMERFEPKASPKWLKPKQA